MIDLDKIRSIAVPGKKRGSHVYSRGGNSKTAVARVREYSLKNPTASRAEYERQVRIEACGAKNQETFAQALEDGFAEVGRIADEAANSVRVAESYPDKTEG
jgi:hypothetical protein